jgi:Flp pilus assembly protein TadG
MTTKMNREESGQALIELSFALVILCVFVFGIIDFGRAIYDVQVMKNLVGEGSSMASRQGLPSLGNTATTVAADAGRDLNMSTAGCVIVTQVSNMGSGSIQVTGQASSGGISGTAACRSKVGCVSGTSGCGSSNATVPSAVTNALTTEGTNSAIYVTEIYYNFQTITPVTALLGSSVMPSQFYAVAYY